MVGNMTTGDTRTIEYADCPSGIVPLRVSSGRTYSCVEASGIAAAGNGDIFYNGRSQHADVGEDKIVLVQATGDRILLKLRENARYSGTHMIKILIFLTLQCQSETIRAS